MAQNVLVGTYVRHGPTADPFCHLVRLSREVVIIVYAPPLMYAWVKDKECNGYVRERHIHLPCHNAMILPRSSTTNSMYPRRLCKIYLHSMLARP